MRRTMPLLTAAAVLATVWAQASAPIARGPTPAADGPLRAAASTPSGAAHAGLAAALDRAGAPPLPGLATAPDGDGGWRLRGRTLRAEGPAAGFPAALHARAEALCDDRPQAAECWRINGLTVSGQPTPVRP